MLPVEVVVASVLEQYQFAAMEGAVKAGLLLPLVVELRLAQAMEQIQMPLLADLR